MNYPNYPFNERTCDYYDEFRYAQDLFVPFTSVLIRMYINYVSKYFNLRYVMKKLCMMQFICMYLS